MVEFRCPSCSTPLSDGLAKCPSCGLPLKPQASETRGRSLFAGFLLLALFAVGALQAGLILADPDTAIQPGSSFGVGSFDVHGVVRDANGTVVSGVNVTLGGGSTRDDRNATTNSSGAFSFEGVAFGVYEVNATVGNRTVLQRILVREDAAFDLALPVARGVVKEDHPSLGFIRVWLQVCGGVVLGLCLVTLLGAISAYRRRAWGLAVGGAVTGAFLWLPLSLLLGIIALVLLLRGRGEFR